ncbi:glutathione S-transferase family protein [Mitsuaria sp. 7]|uniref:glutathione S-transferase family protein n=1 Tax=Mitsuaria sp. 7 TaxID=1658665 RepID=UPI0007DCC536|nr:glutathione S-transferase family protein [Mitsuaria sp. 7]ANH69524.1 glutathione S-transferase [Mitsuaria sp. 7]
MIELYYFPSNASFAPHVVLHELGIPFQLRLIDRDKDEHKSPAYLAINPNGLLPAMRDTRSAGGDGAVDSELVLFETAAILLHLADTHPEAGLMPPLGSAERAQAYKWLMWLTNTLQPTVIAYYYPDRFVAPGNTAGSAEVKAQAQVRAGAQLDLLAAEFERHGGPFVLGERYSVLDAFAFMLCRWTRNFADPARSRPALAAFLEGMAQRPALQRAVETEHLPKPWF